ncbi:hypothetical protein [Nostoc sp. UHCC 0252]|uniref:hypothetical protein n=1 Tax=Nostoc sp. UHCC 0252 TaxID=3110241 RepID=UPI002B1F7019|nr:hypothetical protein [Nostoc sp. UHCC 0252]MEA5605446.1 hypothetical protein [Nostoc sp. UHCC 0252]
MGGHCHPLAYCFIKKLLKGIRRSLYLPQQTIPFVGNSVKVRSLSGAVRFTGEMVSYDKTHGTVTVVTEEGNRDVYLREVFVIG